MNNIMGELEELLEQRREIDRKIKALKNESDTVGSAKIEFIRYPALRPDEWVVSVKTSALYDNECRWRGIIRHPDKETAVKQIGKVIKDLFELQKILLQELGGEIIKVGGDENGTK